MVVCNLIDRTRPGKHVTRPWYTGMSLFQRVVFCTRKGT
ncbi:hypothetical protein F383_38804 [Gossypium arboreum]|uniref:Uncharacterized protein n=1 Tax=Gossypium arboreum TaxID=29729 RepID=A0A0B0MDB8_GOSAR|nr:hypothetical protein F383_38804 [Gossypium arboreum]